MRPVLSPIAEQQRLACIAEYGLGPGDCQDEIAPILQLAKRLFDVNTVLVTFIESERAVFLAGAGSGASGVDRGLTFCTHTVEGDEPLVVPDARLDPRFCDNPFVAGDPHVRFYAGVPLVSSTGHALGTFCLVDDSPRRGFSTKNQKHLVDLAALVLDRLEARRLARIGLVCQHRFEQIAATSPDGIVCADQGGVVSFWNAAAERMFGYPAAEAVGRCIDIIIPDLSKRRHGVPLSSKGGADPSGLVERSVDVVALRKDGTEFPVELSLSTWTDDGRGSFGAIIRDITERSRDRDRLHRLAHLDALTGLPNRTVLRKSIETVTGGASPASVMIVDLDGFKHVNDYFGHSAGDKLLCDVAERLLGCVRAQDTVARLGGDEFAILLTDVGDQAGASRIGDRIVRTMTEPFLVDGQPVAMGTSVGIALYPEHGGTADELMAHADLALYDAKAAGRNQHRLFNAGLKATAVLRRTLEVDLRHAVDRGEFELFYQPQVSAGDGGLIGAEALLRWRHPERGLQAPSVFLPALEGSSLAVQVGAWVLRSACLQAAQWRRMGAPGMTVGVNLFGAQLRSGDFAGSVRRALRAANLPASALELEITENIVLQNDATAVRALQDLRADGVGIAFDDYGTGFASLSLLKTYPVTRLKIDRSFVGRMSDSSQDVAIVRAVMMLGRAFGLSIIAEGVETRAQRDLLVDEGCDEIQGFLFGRPMPAQDFAGRFGLASAA